VIAETLPWIVAAASLLALLAALVASVRAQRQLRAVHEESIATKNEQIASLEAQLASLRESESIRFVDRYVGAKSGLDERVKGLHEELESARSQQDRLRSELTDLGLTDRERETEAERLRQDLTRTTDQIRRLELVLREVANVGPMDVDAIRRELDSRRELATHIKERLDRLSLDQRDRLSSRLSRSHRLERLDEEVARLRREIEITRAAASIVDGILGIDTDTRKRLARHATDRIEGALKSLGDLAGRSPIARFVEVLEQQRPDRLLKGAVGRPARAPEPEPGAPPATGPEPAPEPTPDPERTAAL
jgi:chromosome segregation ATPase